MSSLLGRWIRLCGALCAVWAVALPARADEMWIAPTLQQDTGGLGIGSNVLWPVTVVGASRFTWAVPGDLQKFLGAKLVIIPHAPGGAATLNVIVCAAQSGEPVTSSCAGPIAHPFTGVPNRLIEVDISDDLAPKVGAPGATNLAVVAFTTPTTTTDHFTGLRFTYGATLPAGVATLGANTFSGAQSAPMFVGDGSNLSNVNANLLDGFDSAAFASSGHGHDVAQITNAARLAGGNTFSGSQAINGGNLELGPSSVGNGNILKGGDVFLHDTGFGNLFLGMTAGNFSLTNSFFNTGVGANVLTQLSQASFNTAVGAYALFANETGVNNVALGQSALTRNVVGSWNTAVGSEALFETRSDGNTAVGFETLYHTSSGLQNVAVGFKAGVNQTTGSNNIYLGPSVGGVAGENGTMRLGDGVTLTRAFIAGVRGTTTGTANAVPVVIDSNGQLGTISSSRRFKEDIRDMGDMSRRLYDLRPVTFRYTQAYTDGSKPINYGLVAEEVADVFPELAARGADGEIETVHYETLNVLLLNEVQAQQRRIEKLEQQIETLLRSPK